MLTDIENLANFKSDSINPKISSIIFNLIKDKSDSRKEFRKKLTKFKRKNSLMIKNSEFLRTYRVLLKDNIIKKDLLFENFIKTKQGKSASGILSVTVFTSPYPEYTDKNGKKKKQNFTCKWNCYYCPNHKEYPRSYLPDEPGCLRAIRCDFDAIKQMNDRLSTLEKIGHPLDKLEVLVLGGTWDSYPEEYREEFVRDIFYAANIFNDCKREKKTLIEEQRINENTNIKIIGLTLETRPDQITPYNLRLLRYYGCTRVQIGVQHIDNKILKKVNRGHTIEDTIKAIKLLKDNCWKIDIHIMPDLPGANPEIDNKMFDEFLGINKKFRKENNYIEYELINEYIQADQWKIYPCEVTPWTVIEKWYKEGKYKPYGEDTKLIKSVIINAKKKMFPWIRLNRVIRDIPNQHIKGGNQIVNLRQKILEEMKSNGLSCDCIRCREVGLNNWSNRKIKEAILFIRKYNASEGEEYFISFESKDNKILYGFVRLRINIKNSKTIFNVLKDTALIRELHVYGQLIPTYDNNKDTQHAGFGKKLMKKAEEITKSFGYKKLAIIAGIGTKNYYRKLGYECIDTFMIKELGMNNQYLLILFIILYFILVFIIDFLIIYYIY